MAAALEASMQLRLQDLLSEPLAKIEAILDRIKELGKTVSLDKLTAATAPLNENANAAARVVTELNEIANEAAAAAEPMAALTTGIEAVAEGAAGIATISDELGVMLYRTNESTASMDRLAAAMKRAAEAAAGTRGPGVMMVDSAGNTRDATRDFAVVPPSPPPKPSPEPEDTPKRSTWHGGGVDPMVGLVAGATVFEPIKAYASFEDQLRQIAITKHLSDDQVAPEERRLQTVFYTDSLATGQGSEGLANAYKELLQAGIAANRIENDLRTHSMAATAYGLTTEQLGPVSIALLKTMHVSDEDYGGALASLAEAAKSGRFKMSDFALEMPGIAGLMAGMGVGGRRGVDEAGAALETVMVNSSQPGQGAAAFSDALRYMFQNKEDKTFSKILGVDLQKYLEHEEKKGIDPLEAELRLLVNRLKGKTPVEAMGFLTKLFTNAQSAQAMMALLQHLGEFHALEKDVAAQTQDTLIKDFQTEIAGTEVQVKRLEENFEQLNRTLGKGFAPTLSVAGGGLGILNSGFQWMDTNLPGTTAVVLGLGAAFLSLVAAVGAWSFVGPPVLAVFASSLGLLLGPLGLAVAAMVAFEEIFTRLNGLHASHFAGIVAAPKPGLTAPLDSVTPGGRGSLHLPAPAPGRVESAMPGGRGSVHVTADVKVAVSTDQPGTKAAVTSTTVTTAPNRGPTLGRP